ncbi:MAG: hypothetical protein R6W91_00300 [Thermoplasmata archaeon]
MGNPPPYDPNYGQQPPPQQYQQYPPPPQQGYQQQPYGQQPQYQQYPPPAPKKKSMLIPAIIIAVVAIIVVVVLLFFLLGGSDDGGSLYDTWDINSMEVETSIVGASVTTPMDGTITFNSDGTYTSTGAPAYFSSSGTYTKSGNTLTINSLEWKYTISGNSMALANEIEVWGFGTTTTFDCTRA